MNKKEILDLLQLVNEIEIKGSKNIYLLYKIIAFLQGKIDEIEKKEG